MPCPLVLALATDGSSRPASMAMTAITTSSSTSVNACFFRIASLLVEMSNHAKSTGNDHGQSAPPSRLVNARQVIPGRRLPRLSQNVPSHWSGRPAVRFRPRFQAYLRRLSKGMTMSTTHDKGGVNTVFQRWANTVWTLDEEAPRFTFQAPKRRSRDDLHTPMVLGHGGRNIPRFPWRVCGPGRDSVAVAERPA